jgi:hypothetical protein
MQKALRLIAHGARQASPTVEAGRKVGDFAGERKQTEKGKGGSWGGRGQRMADNVTKRSKKKVGSWGGSLGKLVERNFRSSRQSFLTIGPLAR